MAYTAPVTHATGDVFPASDWNTYVRDNLAYLHGDAGTVLLNDDVRVGGNTGAIGAAAGILVDGIGTVWASAALATTSILVGTVTGDLTDYRVSIASDGTIKWGPGSGPRDTSFQRMAAGVVGSSSTSLTTGPLSVVAGGGGAVGVLVSAAGTVQSITGNVGTVAFAAGLTSPTDTQYRFTITSGGVISMGPGGGTAPDTTFNRGAAGILAANSKLVESAPATVSQAAGTTFTPTLSNGLVQRVNVTTTGTLTIGSPGAPPANFSGFLIIVVKAAATTTTTVAWNAIFNSATGNPATGGGLAYLWFYDQGTAKWVFLLASTE